MSMYDIQITEPAEKDLYEIGAYISKELLDPETAKKVISEIAKGVNSLEDMLLRNVLVADDRLAYEGIRKIMVDNYIVFYIVTDESKTVTIIRILYSRRDWINLL
ncbi:type II toxin-antitoxin system RelE/ParE family toxin [Clostridium algidicarnis]|uniref:type II toxin-antitoxin system RelE/ParE family toxin n=1 Tax=Clostridium algidicarnis TaxID=37659 RepID=UPI00162A1103|nr:type II toxin-antitoxin system RelE/ParE family toxin [Clostridium algidicarnis]MBB6698591.1 type II toxin-antitoxin system RelE/ParE family toxin [Clostridium algidicarnis]